ncbi:hypothetical protein pb186bvf_013390 [Paramecium bursaria]
MRDYFNKPYKFEVENCSISSRQYYQVPSTTQKQLKSISDLQEELRSLKFDRNYLYQKMIKLDQLLMKTYNMQLKSIQNSTLKIYVEETNQNYTSGPRERSYTFSKFDDTFDLLINQRIDEILRKYYQI